MLVDQILSPERGDYSNPREEIITTSILARVGGILIISRVDRELGTLEDRAEILSNQGVSIYKAYYEGVSIVKTLVERTTS